MTILLVGPYPPPHGGVQTHLVAIRDFLQRQGTPCAVINITRHRTAQEPGVYHPTTGFELVRLLLRLQYDIIHLHFGGNLTPRLLALTLVCSLIPGKKTVLTFHSGGYPSSPAGKNARPASFRGFVLRRLDRVVGVNEELIAMFRRFGVAHDRARLIAPHDFAGREAHPSDQSNPAAEWPDSLREFFAAYSPALVTVGGLEPEYGLPAQIEMVGLLRQQFPRVGLAIIGAGSRERGIRQFIDAQPHRDHVLLCGDVPHRITLRAIEKADLMLRTTLYDGDSIAVREALHLGIPVLATDNGMRPAGVRLVKDTRPEELTRAVVEALSGRRDSRPLQAVEGGERNLQAILDLYAELTPMLSADLSSSTSVAG